MEVHWVVNSLVVRVVTARSSPFWSAEEEVRFLRLVREVEVFVEVAVAVAVAVAAARAVSMVGVGICFCIPCRALMPFFLSKLAILLSIVGPEPSAACTVFFGSFSALALASFASFAACFSALSLAALASLDASAALTALAAFFAFAPFSARTAFAASSSFWRATVAAVGLVRRLLLLLSFLSALGVGADAGPPGVVSLVVVGEVEGTTVAAGSVSEPGSMSLLLSLEPVAEVDFVRDRDMITWSSSELRRRVERYVRGVRSRLLTFKTM